MEACNVGHQSHPDRRGVREARDDPGACPTVSAVCASPAPSPWTRSRPPRPRPRVPGPPQPP
ncbi:hypothetical protein FRAAL5904 [Frankia alni ACN14a]|uniref:Uncharacterized protein n=1 Tax=Frankia alni (strain DSM 45986 / CECT 9034 / ACN14a) TaxID=326424 RepID=Q0RDE0_FRAAA|nr:hypothetical protein FRAAL5904 [Frankia alni ACN14a]